MPDPLRITMVCQGDAESPNGAFSGTAWSIVDQFRRLGHTVKTVDSELYGWRRGLLAARTFAPSRPAWRARFHLGPEAYQARSRQAARGLQPWLAGTDVVFQCGATSRPPGGRIPYALYCDWNMALTIREAASVSSEARYMGSHESAGTNAREAAVYRDATAIFTISENLRRSFLDDYGLPPERVVTVYAGANLDTTSIAEHPAVRPAGHPPTVLFTGKAFQRKGGDVLLDAFREVRRKVPDARLLIIGPSDIGPLDPGVELLGFLRKSVPDEVRRLHEAYRDADVFCLPTRYEAFGIVVVEAMCFGLPCVTTNISALPEMVQEGETGYTVPEGEPGPLAERLVALLQDPALARRMGEAGRRRALSQFTWPASVRRMHETLQAIIAR